MSYSNKTKLCKDVEAFTKKLCKQYLDQEDRELEKDEREAIRDLEMICRNICMDDMAKRGMDCIKGFANEN